MNKAIVVYVGDYNNSDIEFSWLYKTWKLWSLDNEYDLVVYSHVNVINKLEKYKGIKLIEMPTIRLGDVFKDLNSFYIFSDGMENHISKYQYILKCDSYSFLTENLKKWTPSKFTLGEGNWILDDNKINFIKWLSTDIKLQPGNMTSIGKSFYGKTSEVIAVSKGIVSVAEVILTKYLKSDEFSKSGFNIDDIVSISTDVFINHAFSNQHVNLYQLDSKSWTTTKIGSNVLQILPDSGNMSWSRKLFFEGAYNTSNLPLRYSFISSANYCNWISKLSLEDTEFYRGEYLMNKLEVDYGLIDVSSGMSTNDKFSVVIPTMWAPDTFSELLISLNNCSLVDEIIIIDNQPNKRPEFNLDKVKLVTKGENIYVNPAWNWGVELAKNNLISICNDDILFNVDETFKFVLDNHHKLGCFGVHKDSYDGDGVDTLHENLYIQASGWGCLMFCKKENWIDIPNSLKIGYGDDWILKTNKPQWSYRTKNKIFNKMSTTSKRAEFNKNVTNDIKIWRRIFQ